jgi:hypothetical protein
MTNIKKRWNAPTPKFWKKVQNIAIAIGAAATLVGGGGTTITDTDTFGGYTLRQIAQALKNLGILA